MKPGSYLRTPHSIPASMISMLKFSQGISQDNLWESPIAERWLYTLLQSNCADYDLMEYTDVYGLLPNMTSPGYPYNIMGYSTKEQVWQGGKFLIERELQLQHGRLPDDAHIMELPIYEACDKDEYLPKSEILDRGKVRDFEVAPADMVWMSARLYGEYDRAKKRKLFGSHIPYLGQAYSWSPQYGGFHRLCASLDQYDLISEEDFSFWDGSLQSLRKQRHRVVQKLARNGFVMRENFFKLNYNKHILFPNGSVYEVLGGICSGDYQTSSEGSDCHLLLLFSAFIYLFYERYNKVPQFSDFYENIFPMVLSDDSIIGINKPYEWFSQENRYKYYKTRQGLRPKVVKPDSVSLAGHTFLGRSIHYKDFCYYWTVDEQKILNTLYFAKHQDLYNTLLAAAELLYYNPPVGNYGDNYDFCFALYTYARQYIYMPPFKTREEIKLLCDGYE
jgi:hypothetical protein